MSPSIEKTPSVISSLRLGRLELVKSDAAAVFMREDGSCLRETAAVDDVGVVQPSLMM
jgi:hypothetical protein